MRLIVTRILRNSGILLQPHRIVVANFVPGNFGLFGRNPGSDSRNPEVPFMLQRNPLEQGFPTFFDHVPLQHFER